MSSRPRTAEIKVSAIDENVTAVLRDTRIIGPREIIPLVSVSWNEACRVEEPRIIDLKRMPSLDLSVKKAAKPSVLFLRHLKRAAT